MIETNPKDTDAIIVVGDRVDLVVESGQVYRAMIEDRVEGGPFLVAIPSRRGIPMHAAQDDEIYLVFYRKSGRYIAQMKVVTLERRGELRYMWLLQKTIAQKNQRRGAFRLPVSFDVKVYEYDEDIEKALEGKADEGDRAISLETADSRDISITGISLITKKQYIVDERYILLMKIESAARGARSPNAGKLLLPLQLTATVKRSIPWRESRKFNTGMQFLGMTETMSDEIAKFVLTEQQRQISSRRLK